MIADDGGTVMTDTTVAMHSRRIFYRVSCLHVYTFDIKIAVLQFLYRINRDLYAEWKNASFATSPEYVNQNKRNQ